MTEDHAQDSQLLEFLLTLLRDLKFAARSLARVMGLGARKEARCTMMRTPSLRPAGYLAPS